VPQIKSQKKRKSNWIQWPKIFILTGIVLIITIILIVKNQTVEQPVSTADQTAEVLLDQYLENGKPTLVFFHSNNCQSCIDMIAIVNQVYPEFEDTIALVDVNVYDPANQNLLQRAKINSIPTQLFIDHSGQGKVTIGIMSPEDLRTQLLALTKGEN
jgi:thiol-disulfide isomerase/thioredoxin